MADAGPLEPRLWFRGEALATSVAGVVLGSFPLALLVTPGRHASVVTPLCGRCGELARELLPPATPREELPGAPESRLELLRTLSSCGEPPPELSSFTLAALSSLQVPEEARSTLLEELGFSFWEAELHSLEVFSLLEELDLHLRSLMASWEFLTVPPQVVLWLIEEVFNSSSFGGGEEWNALNLHLCRGLDQAVEEGRMRRA